MSRILHYDCFAGISGDMNLGALIDLGVPVEYLREELSKLNVDEFEIQAEKAEKMGIYGICATVKETHHHHTHHGHDHDHQHHDNHHHEHGSHEHHHHHRSYADIVEILNVSALTESVRECAKKIFHTLAEAEAQVHQRKVEDVHFHEVGAVDSIVDIVGAAICLDYLKVDTIVCGRVELGSGTVKCAHGVMPVPAPATALLAMGFPSHIGGTDHEATTPTGAAYLAAVVDSFSGEVFGRCLGMGIGIGHRNSDKLPNILRVMLFDASETVSSERDAHSELAANIDDMTAEHLSFLAEKLFEAGADDVWMEPIYMKKGRPGTKVCALVSREKKTPVREAFFRNSTSLGVREISLNKHVLSREIYEKTTLYGTVRVKRAVLLDGSIKEKVEYEDCCRLAKEHGLSVNEMSARLMND